MLFNFLSGFIYELFTNFVIFSMVRNYKDCVCSGFLQLLGKEKRKETEVSWYDTVRKKAKGTWTAKTIVSS